MLAVLRASKSKVMLSGNPSALSTSAVSSLRRRPEIEALHCKALEIMRATQGPRA